jgi:hypothetical protein
VGKWDTWSADEIALLKNGPQLANDMVFGPTLNDKPNSKYYF